MKRWHEEQRIMERRRRQEEARVERWQQMGVSTVYGQGTKDGHWRKHRPHESCSRGCVTCEYHRAHRRASRKAERVEGKALAQESW